MTDPTPAGQPTTPPGSKTLIYAPEVRIVIASSGQEIDVSKDVIRGRVVRAVDAVSQAEFYLNNKNGKYTGKIRRMDKVVIWLKRVTWIQVFTGYLDVVPAYDLFPTEAYFRASCTLKRIKYTYWDKGLPASQVLLNPQANPNNNHIELAQNSPDAGTGLIVYDLLTKVGNWPANQVLIQQIPVKFMDFMKSNIQLVDQTEVMNRILSYIQGGGTANGTYYPWSKSTGKVPPAGGDNGTYTQEEVVSLIKYVWSGLTSGIIEDKIELGAAYVMALSKGDPNYNTVGDVHSYGLFGIPIDTAYAQKVSADQMKDPIENITQAWTLSKQGNDWTYWSNFRSLGNPPATLDGIKQIAPGIPAWIPPADSGLATNNLSNDQVLMDLFKKFYSSTTSEGVQAVIDFMKNQLGLPYGSPAAIEGAPGKGDGSDGTWDCSGLMMVAWNKIANLGLPHNAEGQAHYTYAQRVAPSNGSKWTLSDLQAGDLLFFPGAHADAGGDGVPDIGHVAMYIGNDQLIEAGDPVQINPTHGRLDGSAGYNDTVNFVTRPINMVNSLNDATGQWSQNNENGGADAQYRLFNFLFTNNTSALSTLLRKDFAPANDESLLTSVSQICAGSMRAFMSGPNGDFIAFFPDYFGVNGMNAVWDIEDVEIINLKLQINDDELVTHVYTIGDTLMSGFVSLGDWVASAGEVSIMSKGIMDQVLSMQSNTGFLSDPEAFLWRYGLRPMTNQLSIIRSNYYEFFASLYTFLQQWSKQFSTTVSICFMPELYPGMRMNLKNHDVCVYVESVVHTFDYQNGFQTYPTISCPSTPAGGQDGLPIAMGI